MLLKKKLPYDSQIAVQQNKAERTEKGLSKVTRGGKKAGEVTVAWSLLSV